MLDSFINRYRNADHDIYRRRKQRKRGQYNQRKLKIQIHGHHQTANADKRRAYDQTDHHRYRLLQHVYVIRNSVDHFRNPDLIRFRMGKPKHRSKQLISQRRSEALRGYGRIILADHSASETKDGNSEH